MTTTVRKLSVGILFALLTINLNACKIGPFGKDDAASSDNGGGGGGGTVDKSFFSTWTNQHNGVVSVNMSGFNQGGTPVAGRWAFADGTYIDCQFTINLTSGSGNNSSGTFVTSSCARTGTNASQAGSFEVCMKDFSGTYTHSGGTLTIAFPSCSGSQIRIFI